MIFFLNNVRMKGLRKILPKIKINTVSWVLAFKMTQKRRNRGSGPKDHSYAQPIPCISCAQCTPKDRANKKSMVRNT